MTLQGRIQTIRDLVLSEYLVSAAEKLDALAIECDRQDDVLRTALADKAEAEGKLSEALKLRAFVEGIADEGCQFNEDHCDYSPDALLKPCAPCQARALLDNCRDDDGGAS